MTTKYFALLTNQGAAKLANATALGTKIQITKMGVGDGGGTLPTPTGTQTALVGEKRRALLNALSVDAANSSQIIAEQIIPENEGGFWIREIGLYDSDNTLIAVANCPETYKPLLAEGSGRTQTVRMILIINSTDAVTLKIDPSVVLATRQYVDAAVIEVKTYADSAMAKHGKDANPHKQYLQIASLFEEIALLGDAAVASALAHLGLGGLGTAAKYDVGNGAGQLPDMSAFKLSINGSNFCMEFPNGFVIQGGTVSLSPVAAFNQQTLGGQAYYTHYYRVPFIKAFKTYQVTTNVSLTCPSYDAQASMAGRTMSVHRDQDAGQTGVAKTRFAVAVTHPVTGETPTIHWTSYGY